MKKLLSAATVITALALVAPRLAAAGNKPTSNTVAIVGAADAFLATLTPEQRTHVLYAFNDTGQRGRWSNFPTGVVPRGA